MCRRSAAPGTGTWWDASMHASREDTPAGCRPFLRGRGSRIFSLRSRREFRVQRPGWGASNKEAGFSAGSQRVENGVLLEVLREVLHRERPGAPGALSHPSRGFEIRRRKLKDQPRLSPKTPAQRSRHHCRVAAQRENHSGRSASLVPVSRKTKAGSEETSRVKPGQVLSTGFEPRGAHDLHWSNPACFPLVCLEEASVDRGAR